MVAGSLRASYSPEFKARVLARVLQLEGERGVERGAPGQRQRGVVREVAREVGMPAATLQQWLKPVVRPKPHRKHWTAPEVRVAAIARVVSGEASRDEIAEELNVHPQTVANWVKWAREGGEKI